VPALVSPALWDRVQSRLAQRRAGRPAKRVYLLSGRLRCGVCGRRLYGGLARNGPYYRCASIDWVAAGLAGRCGLKAQHAEALEARVWAALTTAFRDPAALLPHLAHRQIRHAVSDIETQSAAGQLRATVARLDRQIQRVLDVLLMRRCPVPKGSSVHGSAR
jgi:hypothetical protein